MRVAVYGAGAIGGHVAARLAKGGATVSLIGRGAHLAAIQRDGLTVHAFDGTHHSRPAASDNPADLGPQDAVIVTVKAPALSSVAAGIGPLLGPDTPVAFVMNGIPWWYFARHGGPLDDTRLLELDPGDALRQAVGIERTIGGCVFSATAVIAPGVVRAEPGVLRLCLGEIDGAITPRVQALAAVLEAGGFPTPVSADIRADIWSKLVANLGSNPPCVLARRGIRDTLADPVLKAAALACAREALAIAAALGRPQPEALAEKAAGLTIAHKPSLLQDLELGRPMEIDGILATPLKLARLVGVATPTLDLLVALIQQSARAAGLYGEVA